MGGIYSMAGGRGNQKEERVDEAGEAAGGAAAGRLPELARRALSLGLSGFFFTEETIRKALGDTLPREWMDFAVDQSERTRREFLERLSFEIAQSLEKVDLASVLRELLEGRTLEVRAEIRLGEGGRPDAGKVEAGVRESEGER
jgi:hypothetical protein